PEGEFTAHYHYDALGRRIRKTVDYRNRGTETTRFLWQGYRLLQEQRDNATRRTWSYDPASPWAPLAAIEQAGNAPQADIYWLHTDLNSAPLEVTDADGNLRWSGQYDTFGKLRGQTPGSAGLRTGAAYAQPLRFAGQCQDNESGLHYNLFRYYEPEVGRFTTQDPIGLAGGWNLYQYAPNPLGWIDALGLTLTKLQELVKEAHSLLDEYAQSRKTTAIGVDSSGKYHIASSERVVPPVQREWAKENNVNVIRGDGHAEETIMKNVPGVEHIDASRRVCLDCEGLMHEHGVTTDTLKSGKRSRNRLKGCT
ncbi:RHS repeat-associated core domain-containing protein, partial [Mangrovibacter sp. MFB070]|uniref:RHS repeat-associated core domain-containing protein n=1 Tax=Mangrovibacter sp. MFB070 TaxID=1224318 RepID=UPI0026F3CE54